MTDQAGVDGCGEDLRDGETRCFKSMASSWGDYDGDGDLDLYVGNYGFVDETDGTKQTDMEPGERDFLYRNEGDGTFSDVSDLIPPEFHEGYTYAGRVPRPRRRRRPRPVHRQRLRDPLAEPGDVERGRRRLRFNHVDPSKLDVPMTGMGLGIGDLNGDGWPDLAMAEWHKDSLLREPPGPRDVRSRSPTRRDSAPTGRLPARRSAGAPRWATLTTTATSTS